jgi:hypothetical protein
MNGSERNIGFNRVGLGENRAAELYWYLGRIVTRGMRTRIFRSRFAMIAAYFNYPDAYRTRYQDSSISLVLELRASSSLDLRHLHPRK